MQTLVSKYAVRITFTEPLLGSQPQRDIAEDHTLQQAIKAGQDVSDELESLPEELEKSTTAFHRDPATGAPCLWDYQIKGFLKEWLAALNGDDAIGGLKAARKKGDQFLYVFPRRIPLMITGDVDHLSRPLRAETAQGPRIAIARSEMARAGTFLEFQIHALKGVISEKVLRELLGLGIYKGLGQWRNGSYGRFDYELTAL